MIDDGLETSRINVKKDLTVAIPHQFLTPTSAEQGIHLASL
jgi:hypothetical protein